MNTAQLAADLTQEEGYRGLVYDDGTGKTPHPGDHLVGNLTIGVGWNVTGRPCPPDLAQIILLYQIADVWRVLQADHPWIASAPEPVQRALTDLAFNNGEAGLDGFTTFLALVQSGKYQDAAADLQTTKWWGEVGQRGPRIVALIQQGGSV